MKTSNHITRGILCSLLVVLCIVAFAACTFYVPHVHQMGEWTISKEPTCVDPGEKFRECKECGQKETLKISPLGHNWLEATCENPGHCANCGTVSSEALPHNYTLKVENAEALKSAASCTGAAIYYKSCSCGKVSTSEEDTFVSGTALSHNFSQELVKDETLKSAANCTEAAVYYKSCACGAISTSDTFVSGDPFGHTFDQEIAKDVTLKSPSTETEAAVYYKSCLCGEISKDETDTFTYGKPGDHTHMYTTTTTQPTCSEYGSTTYTCVCGYSYTERGTTLAEHTLVQNADPVLYLAKDATCDAAAEYYYSCSVCGFCDESEGAQTFVSGEALDHYYAWVSNNDGTHTGTCQNYGCEHEITEICAGGTATCTQKAICAVCQEYYGDTLNHSWVDVEILSAATCTVAGQKTQVCQNDGCGTTTTVAISATNHSYQSEVTAPTCTTQGYTTYTCQNCGDSYKSDYQAVLSHTYGEWTQTKAPTCTETGVQTRTCSCGAFETRAVDALNHNYTSSTTLPTCTTQGYTTYTCQNVGCGHSYDADFVANSHSWNIEAPTCTQDQICSVCSAKNEATGHSHALVSSTTATCTQAATKTYKCANCEDSYTENVGTPTAHNTVGVLPTLVPVDGEDCLFIEHYTCADCGADVVGDQVENHEKYTASIQNAATCKTEGTKVLTCADCGETKTETIPVDTTLGHSWVMGSVVGGKRTDTCSACGTTKSVTIVTENQANNASDLKDTELSVGGTNINFGQAADSIGSQTQNKVTVGAGTLDESEKDNLGLENEKLEQIGDNPIYNFTVTDTEDNLITNFGEDIYVTITIPYTLKDGEDIDSIAIWFISDNGEIEAIPATYNNGYVTFKTNHFSYYTVTELTPAERCALYDHNYKVSDPIAPTCTEQGYTLKYCIRCRHSEKYDFVDPIGHSYSANTIREASCGQEGLIRHTCSGCHTYYDERIAPLEHNYQLLSEEAAKCTVAGSKTYKCTVCQNVKTEQTAPVGHNYEATEVVASTCAAQGYTVYTCQNSGCSHSYRGNYQPVIEHTFGEWTVTRAATCQLAGEKRRDCTGCDYFEIQTIGVIDHTYTAVVTAPTCDAAGYTTHTCSGCQNSYVDNRQDPTGHKYVGTWEWADDKLSATITISCENAGCRYHTEPITETVTATVSVFDSNDKKEGRKEYTVNYEFDGESYTDTQFEIIPIKDHDHSNCEWQHNKQFHWYKCSYSQGNKYKVPHEFDEGTLVEGANCLTGGKIVYKCICGYEKTEIVASTDVHTPGEQIHHDGEKHWNICTVCNQKCNEAVHEWGEGTETQKGSCTVDGIITYQCACGETKTQTTKAPGHNYQNGVCVNCSEVEPHDHQFDNDCDTTCNFTGCTFVRETTHVYDNACDSDCDICGYIRIVPNHQYQNGTCIYCGAVQDVTHEHEVVDGRCECGYIPVFEVPSYYDYDSDGEYDTFFFTPILPDKFTSEDVIHISAPEDVLNPKGTYSIYDDTRNPSGLPYVHVYCTEKTDQYLKYEIEVAEAGIYEMAIHLRLKDYKERGAKYTINPGTEYEYTFETSFVFANDEEAFATRKNAYTQTSYMFGIQIELVEGKNTILINASTQSPKSQHFRDFYFVRTDGCAHQYVETERVDATCTTNGYVTKVCSVCGVERTWIQKALGHSFSETTITKEPTCTENGERQGICGNCGELATDVVPATGHYTQYERVEFADLGITCGGYGYRYVCQYCKEVTSSYSYDYYCSWNQTAYDEQTNTTTYTCLTCGAVKKYSSVTEYSDTCNFTHVQTYEYYVGGTLVWYRQSTGSGASHTYSYTFELQGTSCTDGYYVTEICRDCGYNNGRYHYSYHNVYNTEYCDFTDYGACYGYISIYTCPCGESGWINWDYCSHNYVSGETYEDNAGITHTVEIYACSSCGLTRIQDYYDQRDGCYTYRYYTYTFKKGDTVITSCEEKSQSQEHHDYEYTYVFDDETNRNCEAGVRVTQTCRNCDYRSEGTRYHHNCDLIKRYDLIAYGASGGYVSVYECPCGYSTNMEFSSCEHGYNYTSSKHIDENGIRWTVETYTSPCNCKIRVDRSYYYTYDTENCTRTRYSVDSVVVGDTLVLLYEHTNTEEYHDYVTTATLNPGSVTCNDGATVTYTCRHCGYSYTNSYSWCNTYETERIDLAQHGSLCGGYISIHQCACGRNASWSLENCACDFEHRSTNDWVEGDIDSYQETANGWYDFYTESYIYTCAVTHPEQCGFVIRYSEYWKKNNDCSATHYLTLQFGYDELTGTYESQKTIELETRTYHNYEHSQLENGDKYTCPDCGSYYTYRNYYNANHEHIKQEQIWVNTLNDGDNKYREHTYEYYRIDGYRWNGHFKTEFHKYIDADGTEWWDKYDYTYGDYTAPFGENAYTKTQVYTNSNGDTHTNECAYTYYKGYEFHLYEHYTNGSHWYKYDYTYTFTNGCSRTRVYTDSNGSNQTSVENGHPNAWHHVTINAPTCTQYGLQGYRCPVCEGIYNTEDVKPTSHNWVLLPTGVYYCYNCGLQGANGSSGSIVMEDLTEKYGNNTAYVIGYWQRIPVSFTPYVTIYLHEVMEIDGVPEQSFILFLDESKFHFVNDEYVGLYVNIADIDAAVAEICELYGVATFTRDMYDVAISFVPDGADSNFDYAIVFGNLVDTDDIDYIIKNDEFLRDYISNGGFKEYTIVSDETVEWVFESYALEDTYVHLYDENGRELACDDDSAGHNNNFLLRYTLEAGKTYIVRVRWYSSDRAGYIPVSFDKRG